MCVLTHVYYDGKIYTANIHKMYCKDNEKELIAFGKSFDCNSAVNAAIKAAKARHSDITFTGCFFYPKLVP